MIHTLRADPRYSLPECLPTPPCGIAALPRDERNFPIPFALKANPAGSTDFAAGIDSHRFEACRRQNRCFFCGQPMRSGDKYFLLEMAETILHFTNELPKHWECAIWEMHVIPHYRGVAEHAGEHFKAVGRVKGLAFVNEPNLPPVQPGRWESLSFYLGGKLATRAVIQRQIILAAPHIEAFLQRIPPRLSTRAKIEMNLARVMELMPKG